MVQVEKIVAGGKKLHGSNASHRTNGVKMKRLQCRKKNSIENVNVFEIESTVLVDAAATQDATSSTCLCKFAGIAGDQRVVQMKSRPIGYGVWRQQ